MNKAVLPSSGFVVAAASMYPTASIPRNVIGRRFDQQIEHAPAGILQRPAVGIVDRLPEQPVGVGHDRSDHIHQLRQTGDLDAIRIAQQRNQQSADQQRVFQVVDFFQQMRRFLAAAVHRIPAALAIPDIPFIERQPQLLRRAHSAAHQVADRKAFSDLSVHGQVHGDEFPAVASGFLRRVFEIAMQRKSVDVVVARLQDLAVPLQIRRHAGPARSAGDQRQRPIDVTHLPRRILRLHAVFGGRHVTDLPAAVHLVAQTPVLHVVRLGIAVLATQVAPLRALVHVAVLHQRRRLLLRFRCPDSIPSEVACPTALHHAMYSLVPN